MTEPIVLSANGRRIELHTADVLWLNPAANQAVPGWLNLSFELATTGGE